jgi:hypothetical protein
VYALSAAFGFLMAAAAAVQADGPAFVAATSASAAVLAGLVLRPAAPLAVIFTVAALALSDPAASLAALSGLCAAAYLVLRYSGGGAVTATPPTVVAAVAFAGAGLMATSVPLHVRWLPLLAPVAVLVIYALVARPFSGDRGRGGAN